MTRRFPQSACLLMAVIVVAGLGLSAYGLGGSASGSALFTNDCCCQTEPDCGTNSSSTELEDDCCQGSEDSDDGPCSCACSGCNATARTINLFSTNTLIAPLFSSGEQRLVVIPDALPASAVLGVDIQPPIA